MIWSTGPLRLARLSVARSLRVGSRLFSSNGRWHYHNAHPDLTCSHPAGQLRTRLSTYDYITGERFRVAFCARCHLNVTVPTPPEEEIDAYYPSGYYGNDRRFARVVEWLLDALYSYRARRIEQRLAPGRVLDIGCGRGLLMNKLRERGWEPHGTELNEDAANYARNHLGLPVTTEALEDIHFPDGSFDLVILWHVLEHIHAPRAMLQEVARILKSGGMLLVAVPNFDSWEARWGGKHWFHLDVPRHLTHFTPGTLRASLEQAGLYIESTDFFSSEYDFYSFVQTAQNKLGLQRNLLYNVLRTRSAKVLGNSRGGRIRGLAKVAIALLTAPLLALFSFFYAPLAAALGEGATIAAFAVKRPERAPAEEREAGSTGIC